MKRKIFYKYLCTLICAILLVPGCKKEAKGVLDESVKDISGSWKIVKLIRNGEDMTERIDLSKFRIIFNADNSYTLESQMAFVVDEPGTYQLDDPQYPFGLILKPQNATAGTNVTFQFPVVGGRRQLSLTLSPGCSSNTYQYFFEKETK